MPKPDMGFPPMSYPPTAAGAFNVEQPAGAVAISGGKLSLGGVRTHLLLLCRLLLRQGTKVDIFATGSNWSGDLLSEIRDLGARIHLPPPVLSKSARLSLLYASMTWPMKVPRHSTSLYCIGAGRSHLFLHRFRPRRTVSINHEIVEPPGPKSLAGRCAETLDTSVANSHKVAQVMRGFWPAKPIQVIPFLTSDRPSIDSCAKARKSRTGPLRVTYLGRLVEQKRPDELVRRWSEITRNGALAHAKLDLFGYDPEGTMLNRLRGLVVESGLSNRVSIHGEYERQDLPHILGESDLVVLPSLWEGLPLVLVEAMLHGVPFVATAAGGTEELGFGNPDVCVTSVDWNDFERGLIYMAKRLERDEIDPLRLNAWAEARYGYPSVSEKWLHCLLQPRHFFNLND